jgi:hypothetical protein
MAQLSRHSSNATLAPPSAADLPHHFCKAPAESFEWLARAEIARGDNVLGACSDEVSGFDTDALGMMALVGRGLLVD